MTYTGFLSSICRRSLYAVAAVMVAAVIILIPVVTTIQAVNVEADFTVYNADFENYTEGDCSHITEDTVKNGNTAGVLKPVVGAKAPTNNAAIVLKDENGDYINRENGYKYFISFYTKTSEDFASNVRIDAGMQKDTNASVAAQFWMFSPKTQWANADTLKNDWQFSYVSITSPVVNADVRPYMSLYFSDNNSAYTTGEVYIDDASVIKYDNNSSVLVFDSNYSGGDVKVSVGKIGDTVLDAPVPVREGYTFGGWYTNIACSSDKKFAQTDDGNYQYPSDVTHLYAKWVKYNYRLDFESGFNIVATVPSEFEVVNDESKAHSGESSLKVVRTQNNHNLFRITDNDGNNISVCAGDTCIIRFYAMVEDTEDLETVDYVQFLPFLTSASNINVRKYPAVTDKKDFYASTERNVWHEIILSFTATGTDTTNNENTMLALGLYRGNRSYTVGNIYIDDISVKIIPEDWELEQPGNNWHLDFEDYDEFIDSSRATADYSVSTELSHDGDKSIKCDYPGTTDSLATINLGENPFIVEPGATYVVSYWSYVPSERQFVSLSLIYFWTSNVHTYTSNRVRQSVAPAAGYQMGLTQTLLWDSPTDEWVKHTTVFTVSEDIGDNNALNIGLRGAPGPTIVYIDDMTITKVDKGNNYILYYTNDDEENDVVVQGKAGDAVEAYVPSNKTDCAFSGWYSDEKYTMPVEDSALSVIPEESMSVYAWQLRVMYRQNFEDYNPDYGAVEMDYELYSESVDSYKAENVYSGKASMHRIGESDHNKLFSVFLSKDFAMEFNKKYVVTFWMKVNSYNDENDCVSLVHTNSWSYARSMDSSDSFDRIVKLSDCEQRVWKKYSFEFTNINSFIAFETPSNSDVYFDDIAVYIKGYETMDPDYKKIIPLTIIAEDSPENTEDGNDTDNIQNMGGNSNAIQNVQSGSGDDFDYIDSSDEVIKYNPQIEIKNDNKQANTDNADNNAVGLIVIICVIVLLLIGVLAVLIVFKKKSKNGGSAK